MPSRVIGPFPELSNLKQLDGTDQGELLDCMSAVHDALEANDCQCNGHGAGNERDPQWGADISELVHRSIPHEITGRDREGKSVKSTVKVKLDTLKAVVDSAHEICAWIYEES